MKEKSSYFPDGEAGQRGKGTHPRIPSRSLGTLEPCLACLPSISLLCHLTGSPTAPRSSLGLLQFLTSSPILLPTLPRPACRLTSPLLCSPIAASAFFSRALEPGEAPHPLFGQCFWLSAGPSQLAPGPPPGWACPSPSTSSLSQEGQKGRKEPTLPSREQAFSCGFGIGWAEVGRASQTAGMETGACPRQPPQLGMPRL